MSLAEHAAADLKVILTENSAASFTRQTTRVVLEHGLRLKIRSLDTRSTSRAERVVELMVVVFAVRIVVKDVERSRREWRRARLAHETRLVVPARQPAVGGLDAFAYDLLIAAAALVAAFAARGAGPDDGIRGRGGRRLCLSLRLWWCE